MIHERRSQRSTSSSSHQKTPKLSAVAVQVGGRRWQAHSNKLSTQIKIKMKLMNYRKKSRLPAAGKETFMAICVWWNRHLSFVAAASKPTTPKCPLRVAIRNGVSPMALEY